MSGSPSACCLTLRLQVAVDRRRLISESRISSAHVQVIHHLRDAGGLRRDTHRSSSLVPCECAAAKIIRQKCLDNVRGPFGVVGVQKAESTANDSFRAT
jgi:hypothetical protein